MLAVIPDAFTTHAMARAGFIRAGALLFILLFVRASHERHSSGKMMEIADEKKCEYAMCAGKTMLFVRIARVQ
jgi:hypothetical protein